MNPMTTKNKPPTREPGAFSVREYPRIKAELFGRPWIIAPDTHAAIRDTIERHENRLIAAEPPTREGENICGGKVAIPGTTFDAETGIAIVPVAGVLARKIPGFRAGNGATDMLHISRDLAWARDTEEVRAVILDIDSPGGTVNGTPELADAIKAVGKPVYAYSAGMIASGAYWLASATRGIFVTKSAVVGSIGVYVAIFDESAAFEKAGITVELIKSGTYKGTGFPGTKLSEESRAMMQQEVEQIHDDFKAHVIEHRGNVADSVMEGQTFRARDAWDAALIDDIVASIDGVIEYAMAELDDN